MKVCYYPGCTLRTKAKELDIAARNSAAALGVTLEELARWQCCGGVFTTARDEVATKLSAVRALAAAGEKGQPLVTVCSACHNVLKQTNYALQTDPDFAARVHAYMADEPPYTGQTRVLHYLELLRDVVGFDKVREQVKRPLNGRRIAAYYGCLLLRPGRVMRLDDVENPTVMEDLIRALGGEPVLWPARGECCGGYRVLEDGNAAAKQSARVIESAKRHGAEEIVTACPLCKYNLEKHGCDIPVSYFTPLLAQALGLEEP